MYTVVFYFLVSFIQLNFFIIMIIYEKYRKKAGMKLTPAKQKGKSLYMTFITSLHGKEPGLRS